MEEFKMVEWVCCRCGRHGSRKLLSGLCDQGVVSELVLAHSLACNSCDGDARMCLRLRLPHDSDADWERTKEEARNRAAQVHHKEPVPMVAGEPRYSVRSLREYLSGEPRWDDWARAARYVR